MLLSGATIASRLAMFALAIVFGRHLGATEYGIYGFSVALAVVLVPLADLGMTAYLEREVAQNRSAGVSFVPDVLRAKVAASAALLALAGAIGAAVSDEADALAATLVVLASALVDAVCIVGFAFFRGRERMGFEARVTAATALLRAAGGIALVLATNRLMPALLCMLAIGVGQLAIVLRRLLRDGALGAPAVAGPARAIAWRTVLTMGVIGILLNVYARIDSVLVGILEGNEAVGLYTAAYTIMLGEQIVPFMIASAVAPALYRTLAADRHEFGRLWRAGLRAVLLISLPLALVTCLRAEPLMTVSFGEDFARAATPLAILAWVIPVAAINSLAFGVLRAAHAEGVLTAVTAASVVLNIGGNVLAIRWYGMTGAASVTLASEAVMAACLLGAAARRGLLVAPHLPVGRMVLALGALAAAAVATARWGAVPSVGAGLAGYVIVAAATGLVGAQDVRVLRGIVARRAPDVG